MDDPALATPAQGFQNHLCGSSRVPDRHAAKPNEDGRRAFVQEIQKVFGRLPVLFGREPIAGNVDVLVPIGRIRNYMPAKSIYSG
jgi:hypothetical protein